MPRIKSPQLSDSTKPTYASKAKIGMNPNMLPTQRAGCICASRTMMLPKDRCRSDQPPIPLSGLGHTLLLKRIGRVWLPASRTDIGLYRLAAVTLTRLLCFAVAPRRRSSQLRQLPPKVEQDLYLRICVCHVV